MENFPPEIKAKNLLADYSGANNYIIGLKNNMLNSKTFTLTRSQADYINKNYSEKANEMLDVVSTNFCDGKGSNYSQWAQLNPTGSGDLQNVNLLRSGYHMGIDTIGNSLRNANQQLRSEPANPQLNVGPWNNTTIEPDLSRVPLELGQGGQ